MRFKNLPDMLISGGNAQPHFHALACAQEIDIPRHEGRLGLHRDGPMVRDQDLQALPREAVLRFQGLVGVTHPADPHAGGRFALDLLSQQLRGVHFNVHKGAPLLFMPAKAAHEACVAIAASVLATGIGIDRVGEHLGLGKNALGLHFIDNHITNF